MRSCTLLFAEGSGYARLAGIGVLYGMSPAVTRLAGFAGTARFKDMNGLVKDAGYTPSSSVGTRE